MIDAADELLRCAGGTWRASRSARRSWLPPQDPRRDGEQGHK